MNNLRKGKWEKAKSQLVKSIRKDSLNPSATFALSLYFFTPQNPDFQIDSAYRYAIRSLSDYQLATIRQRERLKKIPLDSMILLHHRERIDSAAFERAKSTNTEAGYISFLKDFPQASDRARAIELRDEVAFLDAMKEHTYNSFFKYLEKYPQSARASEARTRYEKLFFESRTSDKRLASYESFLADHPETFHRKEIELQIFEIMTASGEISDFEKFLNKYPQSSKARMAKNILYHLLKTDERNFPQTILNDSIQKLQLLEEFYLVPFLTNDKFGFMNERGEVIIEPTLNQINEDYLCGNVTDDLLVLEDQILARNSKVIYKGDIKDVELLGYGFLKINTQKCVSILHYSGFIMNAKCYEDAKMIGKNYLALKLNNRWAIATLTGRMLSQFEWDEVERIRDVMMLKKSGKYSLTRISQVWRSADQQTVSYLRDFDEVKTWPDNMLWIRRGRDQGVLDQNLQEWIKTEAHEINQTFFGAVTKAPLGYKLHERHSTPSQSFIRVQTHQPWVAVQQNGVWQLFDPVSKKNQSIALDTISFNGPFSIGARNDSIYIYLPKGKPLNFLSTVKTQFIPGKDSLFFLLVEEGDKKSIYDSRGSQLFTGTYDKIEYNNEGFFTITKKDKRGLMSSQGKIVIQPDFDAIGAISKGIVQVLRDKKFGLLNLSTRKEIKPEYDKNIVAYNHNSSLVFKNGSYGLVGWDNKPVIPIEFEEIRYWNDSTALVKKNFNWSLYNFVEKKVEVDKIRNFKWVIDSNDEKIIIAQQENNYGVISNRKGIIIPSTFTDVVNLGSPATPLYFTEKHVEEASIYVVIYYDKNGKQLKRQVFEIDDYEKIYCSGN